MKIIFYAYVLNFWDIERNDLIYVSLQAIWEEDIVIAW